MNLQQILIQLRGEETPNQAALRIGISSNYYRDLERGYYLQSGKPLNPSKEIIKKIAVAFKIDYDILAKAANLPVEKQNQPIPFPDHPHLHQWYKGLPSENLDDIEKLYSIWQMFKGGR